MRERNYHSSETSNVVSNAEAQSRYGNRSTATSQRKLFIGAKNDAQENEADTTASKVMRTPNEIVGNLQQNPLPLFIQKKENGQGQTAANNTVSSRINDTKDNGNAMDSQTRSFMESRFGKGFQDVRIHTGGYAAQLSGQLNAKAFTVGKDVYFNQQNYAPNTAEGRHLLAHELTHTVQQGENGAAIQKEDKDKPTSAYAPTPEIDYKVLPPEFQLKLFHFLLKADTSTVHLDYNAKTFMAGLSYQYGDALSLNMRFMDFKTKLGWTPGSNNLSLGLDYKGVNANLTANPMQQKFGLGLHYGASLLPFQDQMANTFNAGGNSFGNLVTGLPGAFHNPIAFYQQNKAEVENVTKTADLVKQITEAGKSKIRFGADFSITYDPVNKLVIGAKAGLLF